MGTSPAEEPEGVSFIVPCRNAGGYVSEAVESIMAHRLDIAHEIVLVDDASDDVSTRRAIVACRRHSAVRVVTRLSCGGVQVARNDGIRAARFRYVLPLDADDRLTTRPGFVGVASYPESAVAMLKANPDVAFVHTFSQMFGDFSGLTISAYPCAERLVAHKHHVPTSIVYRRSDAITAGLYDPLVYKWQDWSFGVALLAARRKRGVANSIGCVPGPYHQYRVHSGARISVTNVAEFDMTLRTVEQHPDFFRHHLRAEGTVDALAQAVLDAKPSRLTDLMHMAAFNLDQAVEVARQRGFVVSSGVAPSAIP